MGSSGLRGLGFQDQGYWVESFGVVGSMIRIKDLSLNSLKVSRVKNTFRYHVAGLVVSGSKSKVCFCFVSRNVA